jgi:hypothetical protein
MLSALLAKPLDVYTAPALVVPEVFDRAFCRHLIDLYETTGGREIGLIENEGEIIERLDYYISDENSLQRTRELLERRLQPMVYPAFQFNTTRVERYLVGCYDASTGGYLRPHRDTQPLLSLTAVSLSR